VVVPGIGKAIAQKLAKQGLNVVLVALGDDALLTTHEEMQSEFPGVEIRKVQPPFCSAAAVSPARLPTTSTHPACKRTETI
jgi:short-subunit dehydrogenase